MSRRSWFGSDSCTFARPTSRSGGVALVGTVGVLLCLGSPALAQEASAEGPNILYPKFRVGAGAFASFFNTNLRVDSEQLGIGTEIDLEDDLGFDTKKFDFRGGGYWRPGRRHRIDFGYFSLSRRSTTTIDEEIMFGDEVFPVDTDIEANFRTSFALLGYRYSFVANPKVEASVGIGTSAMFTNTGISAVGMIGEEEVDAATESKDVTFPIANIGVGVGWNPISRLAVQGWIGGLYVKISDIQASVGNVSLATEYFFIPNFGLGVGYNYVKLQAENTSGNTIKMTYRYSGLLLYAIGAVF